MKGWMITSLKPMMMASGLDLSLPELFRFKVLLLQQSIPLLGDKTWSGLFVLKLLFAAIPEIHFKSLFLKPI